jgi:hypothetical protein
MPATPEIEKPIQPEIQEVNKEAEFVVPETLQQSTGVQVVQKNFTAQVKDDHGQPLIQTPPTQIIQITPPADTEILTTWSKGSIDSTQTWLGAFWLRVVKRALLFGWKILGKDKVNAT